MKVILTICLVLASALLSDVQAQNTTTKKTQVRKSAREQRGSGISHGSRDTTPGSPMGTGGAGGQEMAGSPAGSAIATDDQTEQAVVKKKHTRGTRKTSAKKTTRKATSTNATPPTRSKPQ